MAWLTGILESQYRLYCHSLWAFGTRQVYGFHLIIGVLETTPVTELGLAEQPDSISQGLAG